MALGYDGSIRIDTKINSKGFNSGIGAMTASLGKLAAAVGIAFGVAAVINFGRESVKAASQLSSSLIGLQSIVEGQGRSFSQAKGFINDYIKDGLIPMKDAVTAYKNLAMRGYGTEQIEQTMIALKNASTFGRSAALTMGEAVSSATEGLRNENSILVDNSGVTKNVSMMWADYAKKLGVGVQSLTKAQKIQAEVNGIMEETRFQMGDAAKAVNTYAGQMSMLSFNFTQLKVAVGNAIMPIVQAVLPGINAIISALTTLANVFAQVTSLLFGGGGMKSQASTQKEIASSAGSAAGATDDLANATGGMGDASKKAAKDMKGVTAGFDDLNVLASSAADSMGSAADSVGGMEVPDFGGGGVGEMFGDVEINPEIAAFVDGLRESFARLNEALGPTKEALAGLWEQLKIVGGFSWDGLKLFYDNFLRPVGDWALGEGLPRLIGLFDENLQNINWEKINASLGVLWTELSKIATFAGNALIDFYEFFLKPIAEWTMNEAIPRLVDALSNGLARVDWETIRTSLQDLWKALEPFAINVGEGLLWLYENVLIPIRVWTANELLPRFLNILASAIDILNAAIELAKPVLSWLFENFLDPVARFTGGVIVSILQTLADLLQLVADNIEPILGILIGVGTAISGIKIAEFMINIGGLSGLFDALHLGVDKLVVSLFSLVGAFAAKTAAMIADKIETLKIIGLYAKDFIASIASTIAYLAKETGVWIASTAAKAANAIQQGIMTAATLAWNAAAVVGAAVTTAFGAAVAFLTSPVGLVVIAITALIAIVVLLVKNWDKVKEIAAAAWEKIKEVWSAAATWIFGTVVQPIAGFFSGLWDGVKAAASSAWEAIKEVWSAVSGWFDKNIITPITTAFKGFMNGLIGFVEGFVNFFIRGINAVIGGFNKLSIKIPDNPITGAVNLGINIPKIPSLNLPRLANGAIIPPNQQFAAILGDQRSGVNIETPLSTMVQAFETALSKGGYGGGGGNITVILNADGKTLARVVVPHINDMTRSAGKPILLF